MSSVDFHIPFGYGHLAGSCLSGNFAGIFESGVNDRKSVQDGAALIREALDNPIASPRLEALAASASSAVIIASDHTRPVPSKLIIPQMLSRLRQGNPAIRIDILIATGCHRETSKEELERKFGPEIVAAERIFIHDCRNEAEMVSLGALPSGGELKVNRRALDCDLLLSEGFVEPHFFAGFSGGRKSVLPGIASERTVMGNHCSKFIADPGSRAGRLDGNPIHKDMVYAARKAGLKFILNVVLDADRNVIKAVAGDMEAAHREACGFLSGLCAVDVPESDIVVTGNGGAPLDQNIYQAVKGMSAAEAVCRPGGVIIMAAECADGHGGESFYKALSEASNADALYNKILKVPQEQTLADQWEAQILARILRRFKVIMVAAKPIASTIEAMHMHYAGSLPEAFAMAFKMAGPDAKVAVIPDGVSVIARKI